MLCRVWLVGSILRRIKAETVCAMASKYAIALYELLQLRASMDRCVEVFPGSHKHGLASPGGGVVQPDMIARRQAEAHVLHLPAKAGEMLLLHNHLWHRSARSESGKPGPETNRSDGQVREFGGGEDARIIRHRCFEKFAPTNSDGNKKFDMRADAETRPPNTE